MVSELVGLQIRDIQISDAGLIVTLRRSKMDQGGAGSQTRSHSD
jgi:hypothetical protein